MLRIGYSQAYVLERLRLKSLGPACWLNAAESLSRGKGLSGTGTLRNAQSGSHPSLTS